MRRFFGRIVGLVLMGILASACATTGKVTSSLLPPLPALAENGADEKSRNEDIQRALASVGLLRLANSYAIPQRFEPFGKNVYEVSLAALEKEGCEKGDARLFACAVALSRLHRYSEAAEKHRLVSSGSGLYEDARKKADEMAALGVIEKQRVVFAKDDARSFQDSLAVLSAERERWLVVVTDEAHSEEVRSLALEEVERVDAAYVAVWGRMESSDGNASAALEGLVAQHGSSKNVLAWKLLLVKRLLWQRELEIAGTPHFYPTLFWNGGEELRVLEDRITVLLESVAAEDGTPEKVEALHLLAAFQINVKRVRP